MRVKELIQKLDEFDDNDDVLVFTHTGSYYFEVEDICIHKIKGYNRDFQNPVIIETLRGDIQVVIEERDVAQR